LTAEQDAGLRGLLAEVPPLDPGDLAATLHAPGRKHLLAGLARRDPSLAYRAASHLWARDLAALAGIPAARWAPGPEWPGAGLLADRGTALLVPPRDAGAVVLLDANRWLVGTPGADGLAVEPLATLGLRGAGLARVRVGPGFRPEVEQPLDPGLALAA